MGNEKLFSEFPPVSTQQWEEMIRHDLKGADYEKKLIWETLEGIQVKPYYRAEDLINLSHLEIYSDESTNNRENRKSGNLWKIRQDIRVNDVKEANQQAIEAVEQGATSLEIITSNKNLMQQEFSTLLNGIHFDCIHFSISTCEHTYELFSYLIDEAKKRHYELNDMDGCIHFDPLSILTTSGNYAKSEKDDFESLKSILILGKEQLPKYRTVGISGYLFQETGGTSVQELAYSLAMANEYLVRLTEMGLSVDDIAPKMHFIMATSANYFFEIAKIRALRLLWNNLLKAYNPVNFEAYRTFIHCTSLKWNMTTYDPYVNMLRSTTEGMSAVVGGVDSISIRPFDAAYKKPSGFSNHIARNIQLILKEETYLDRIVNPADGSYFIESLTNSIAEEAWKLFQKIEAEGGYSEAFKKGIIKKDIEEIAQKRTLNLISRKDTLLGTNQYPNFSEKILDNIDHDIINDKQKISSNPIAQPLKRFRGAEEFEELRLRTERSGHRPKVFMLTIGNLAMRLARSQFSCNFFAIAGFEVIDNNGFYTIDDGVKEALAANADIVVLCSSDDEYAGFAPETYEKLGSKVILVVAGAPACMEELKAKGITNFINVKSNVLETLKDFQKQLI